VVILGHLLSDNAVEFINRYEKQLDRKWRYDRLPYDAPSLGDLSYDDNNYVIKIKKSVTGDHFDAVFCHEFYHAFQISRGYPTVMPNNGESSEVIEYVNRLNATVLDLAADDVLKKHNVDNSFVVAQRFRQAKEQSRRGFSRTNAQYAKDLLAIDLIINLHGVAMTQKNALLQELKKALPGVYDMYSAFMEKVEEYGFGTAEGCFKILGYVISYVSIWEHCHILYCGNQICNLQQFQDSLARDRKVENKLVDYFVDHRDNYIGADSIMG